MFMGSCMKLGMMHNVSVAYSEFPPRVAGN